MSEEIRKPTRLGRARRREQLLTTAREVLAERGLSGFSMESLSAAAGVNRALPYRHFDNADAVLIELYRQVSLEIGTRVLDAAQRAKTVDDRIKAVVTAYLDCVFDNADLLKILTGPISPRSAFEDPRVGIDFAAHLLVRMFGFSERGAWASASVVQGALSGGVGALMNEEASRAEVDDALVTILTSLVERYSEGS